jgi:hypothetical protein
VAIPNNALNKPSQFNLSILEAAQPLTARHPSESEFNTFFVYLITVIKAELARR